MLQHIHVFSLRLLSLWCVLSLWVGTKETADGRGQPEEALLGGPGGNDLTDKMSLTLGKDVSQARRTKALKQEQVWPIQGPQRAEYGELKRGS